MACCCICRFLKRTFLYQILIVIAALKLQNAFRYNKEFVERISTFLSSINLPKKLVNYLPENKEYTHKGFLISIIVFASFSMLGINFFKILSGICCILLAFLYHNPIFKIKELFKGEMAYNWETFEKNLPELEFILYICIAFAMFGNAFEQKVCQKDQDKDDEKKEKLIEEKEKKDENVKENKGNKKNSTNKNKNKDKKNKKKKD